MKTILTILLSLSIYLQADLSVKQIQSMVNKIHQKRDGISLDTLASTKEPFVRLQTENNISTFVIPTVKTTDDVKLVIHAIMNGKAYINESWMDVNESILGYKLKHIGNRGVVLRNENHIKKLYLRKMKDNLIKFEETE
jgi:hypothetical protein